MIKEFYTNESCNKKKEYIENLKIIGSLSNLFSESESPFLYYRIMEKIFSKVFDCDDLSRSDITIDVRKGKLGIGLKTFLHHKNGSFQKIAEFNKVSHLFRHINEDLKLIQAVSYYRNKRLDFAVNSQGLSETIYHVITRDTHKMYLYEEDMTYINLEKITIDKVRANTILFNDGINSYSFSKSKNTLMMKFLPKGENLVEEINVDIYDDPLSILKNILKDDQLPIPGKDYIILPLYSDRLNEVTEKAGLNMWNASGRLRHHDEVYFPIPKWIHNVFNRFFNYRNNNFNSYPFNVTLPDGKTLNMKITQSNGKALQSNPNKALGKWILRDVLRLPINTLVTKNLLDEIGIDSIQLTKNGDEYKLDFLPTNSFLEFKKEYYS